MPTNKELEAIFAEVKVSFDPNANICQLCCGSYGGGKARYEAFETDK